MIVTFDGTPVEDYHQVQRLAADSEVGKTVKVEIIRDRAKRTIDLKIAEATDTPAAASADRPPPR